MALLNTVNDVTFTEGSPTWVLNVSPSTPMKSPRSKSFLNTSLYSPLSSPGHNSSRLR